ncbi:MAG: acyltransferase [Bryobacterales bacterium]|nr:acyltransferase [Bryobacterales bacterium]
MLERFVVPDAGKWRPDLPSRIPSLDGLRAISIVLVLLGHLVGTQNFPNWIHPPASLASLGVRVFFVISGFLITSLLLKEWEKTGSISLRQFYLRRAFRIFPAFYLYIGVVAVLVGAGWFAVLDGDFLHALTYTMNYHHPHGWPLAHLWSLAVEEQFYLIWPALFLLAGPGRAMKVAAGVILVSPFLRLGTWQLFESLRPTYGQQFEAVADALASGCLFAGVYNSLGAWEKYQQFLRSRWFWVAPVILGMLPFLDKPRIQMFAGQTVMNLCILLIIERMVRYPETAAAKVLNLAPLRFVGVLSYSLYLWQQIFLNRHSTSWIAAFPMNLVFALALAVSSYYFVERPFLRLKEKLGAAKATARPRRSGPLNVAGATET